MGLPVTWTTSSSGDDDVFGMSTSEPLVMFLPKQEHDERLRHTLEQIQQAGVRLSKEKYQFDVMKISNLGRIVENNHVRPDERKLKAITEMPRRTTKKELWQLMGMPAYLGHFAPSITELLRPLSSMLPTKQEFVWEAGEPNAFCKWKTLLSSNPVLAVYSNDRATKITAGAISYCSGPSCAKSKRTAPSLQSPMPFE